MARPKLKTPTKVYAVERVFDYVGSEIQSVHTSLETAQATHQGTWKHQPTTQTWTLPDPEDTYFTFVITVHDLRP